MPIKHNRQSSRQDNGDTDAIQPSDWNADHIVEGMLSLLDAVAPTPNSVFTLDGASAPQLTFLSAFLRARFGDPDAVTFLNALGAATLASPHLTGIPTAPTAALGINTTQIATMAAVKAAIDNLVNSAPGALDTLNELAAALGNDANFAATVTAALAQKAPLASPALSGTPTAPTPISSDNSTRISTTAFVQALIAASVGARGQCSLSKSGANLVLLPRGGNLLTIAGVNALVPDAGVALAATGLSPGTTYYIYATQSGGVVNTLEASATGHTTDTSSGNKGVEIKIGDNSRSLVGMARIIAGPAWVDTSPQRFVRSWFNDGGIVAANNFTANQTTVATSAGELSSATRAEFLLWSGEVVEASITATGSNSAAGGRNNLGIAFNAGVLEPVGVMNNLTNLDVAALSLRVAKAGLSEGFNDARILGWVLSGTGTYYGDADGRRTGVVVSTRR